MPDSGRLSLLVGIVVATACGGVDELDTSPGVTWALASHRANTISELRYNISLSVPASRDEQIRGHEAVVIQLPLQSARRAADTGEFTGGLQVRAVFEQADVDPFDSQQRNELQHLIVGEDGEGEIGAGERYLHASQCVGVKRQTPSKETRNLGALA